MSAQTPDNVVELATKFTNGAPVEVAPRDWLACQHEHVWLDEKLRIVACRDCGEERLDPFETLLMLARRWSRWKYEAEQLRKLRTEHNDNEKAKWERRRDRHLTAHPAHAPTFAAHMAQYDTPKRGVGYNFNCRQCYGIAVGFDSRWWVRKGPEPPPGRLTESAPPPPGRREP